VTERPESAPGPKKPSPLPGLPVARPHRFPRDAPERPPYRVRARNRKVESDWKRLAEAMPDEMNACWDHLAHTPLRDLGDRCHKLEGVRAAGVWQYKVTLGHSHRVWYRVDNDEICVLVIEASLDHPKKYPGGKSAT